MDWLLLQIDPVLIAPYRWFHGPILSWWIGTFFVSLWAAVIGEATLAGVHHINKSIVKERIDETATYRDRSMNALTSGDKKSYKLINKLANESFGRSFFLLTAMGMASIWPLFFAAAWLQERFGHIRFPFPYLQDGLNFLPSLIVCYVLARVVVGKVKKDLIQIAVYRRQANSR